MAIVFEKRDLISTETMEALLTDLEQEYRVITGFIRSLTKGSKRLPEYQVKDALRALQRLEVSYEKG